MPPTIAVIEKESAADVAVMESEGESAADRLRVSEE